MVSLSGLTCPSRVSASLPKGMKNSSYFSLRKWSGSQLSHFESQSSSETHLLLNSPDNPSGLYWMAPSQSVYIQGKKGRRLRQSLPQREKFKVYFHLKHFTSQHRHQASQLQSETAPSQIRLSALDFQLHLMSPACHLTTQVGNPDRDIDAWLWPWPSLCHRGHLRKQVDEWSLPLRNKNKFFLHCILSVHVHSQWDW